MTCCTYDNPETMARECWQDGRLLCKYDAELLLSRSPIPREYLFFGANIGPWKEGQLWGDPAAMKSEVRAHVEAYARANINVATAAKDAEIEVLRAERDALVAENVRLREDAERWRALREMDGGEIYALLGDCDGMHPEQADAAIDQARGNGEP